MATVYKIKIDTTSAWVSYNEKYIQEMFEKFLKEYKDENTGLGFENTTVEVDRKP